MRRPPIALLLLDVDGVLTDGTVRCSARGDEEKSLFMRDVDAVFEARRRGLRVGLVTGEDTPWVDFVAGRLEVELVARGATDKLAAVRRLAADAGVDLDAVCFVGDGDRDAPALAAVGLGLAPHDAGEQAKGAAAVVLSSPGGRGAVAEAVTLALRPAPAAPDSEPTGGSADEEHAVAGVRDMLKESAAVLGALAESCVSDVQQAARLVVRALAAGGKVLVFGNGGSAADAQHMAAELVGRFQRERAGLPAIALTANSSVVTALGNDFGLVEVFARQVEALGRPGDVAVAISTSGRSPNVVEGVRRARALGLQVVALTGAGGGDLGPLADACVAVPSSSVARIQEGHAAVIHAICSAVDANFRGAEQP